MTSLAAPPDAPATLSANPSTSEFTQPRAAESFAKLAGSRSAPARSTSLKALLRSSTSVLARRTVYLFGTGLLLLYVSVESVSSGLLSVLVPFSLVTSLCLWPFFWAQDTDPFEPASISGTYAGVAHLSVLLATLVRGRVDFEYIHGLSPASAEALAAKIGWALVLGQACYLIGYYSPFRGAFRRFFPSVQGWRWDPTRLAGAMGICLLISLPVYAYFQGRVGTALWDVTNVAAGKAVWREDPTQTWIYRGVLFGFIPPMLYLAYSLMHPSPRRYLISAIAIGVASVLVLRLGQRGYVVMFVVSCAILVHYLKRRIPIFAVFGGLLIALAASNVLLEFRKSSDTRRVDADLSFERFRPTQVLVEHEEDRSRLAAMGVIFDTFPERRDYLLGESWLGAPVLLIPRWIWPNKWESFAWRDTAIVFNLVGAPIPSPFAGVLYANFSWVGIAVGMVLWGAMQRSLFEWLRSSASDPNVVLLYANLIFVQAPTLFGVQQIIQFVGPLYILLRLIARRRAELGAPVGAASS